MTEMDALAPAQAPDVHEFLRARLTAAFDDNLTRMGEACDATPSMVRKWTSDDPRLQTVPSPASCHKIARALGVEPDYLLALAGHRAEPPEPHVDPDLALVNAAWPRLSDGLREAIKILAGRGGGASSPSSARVSRVSAARVREPARGAAGNAGRKPTLTAPYRPVRGRVVRRAAACILDRWLNWLRPWQPALA